MNECDGQAHRLERTWETRNEEEYFLKRPKCKLVFNCSDMRSECALMSDSRGNLHDNSSVYVNILLK